MFHSNSRKILNSVNEVRLKHVKISTYNCKNHQLKYSVLNIVDISTMFSKTTRELQSLQPLLGYTLSLDFLFTKGAV